MISAAPIPGNGRVTPFTDHSGSRYLCCFQNPHSTDSTQARVEFFCFETCMGQKTTLVEKGTAASTDGTTQYLTPIHHQVIPAGGREAGGPFRDLSVARKTSPETRGNSPVKHAVKKGGRHSRKGIPGMDHQRKGQILAMNDHPASAPATDCRKIGIRFLDESMGLEIAECDARSFPLVNPESRPLNPGEQHLIERHLHRTVESLHGDDHVKFVKHECSMLPPLQQGVTLFLHGLFRFLIP